MSFSQEGVRRSAPARTEDGTAMPKGMEVVVTRYEKGVAYVRPWEELTDSKAWGDRPDIKESYRNTMPDGGPDAK